MNNISALSSNYQRILQSQQQLTNYLKYIRHKQPLPKICLNTSLLSEQHNTQNYLIPINKRQCLQVKQYVTEYVQLIKQIHSLQNYLSKKIIKKLIVFLQQFPTMGFLLQIINSFGKDKKKICLNQSLIMSQSNDDMIPLYQKIIEKIQNLKKQGESKKLLELGHRIQHLQILIDSSKKSVLKNTNNNKQQYGKIFKTFEGDRVDKYLAMQQSINKAQKNFGEFSVELLKNKEVFSNLNKVYSKIKQAQKTRIR